MDCLQKIGRAALVLAWLLPGTLLAGGYSEYENHQIWLLRLAAQRHAAQEAKDQCAWSPASPTTFSDQLSSIPEVPDQRLLLSIMAMIRLDQNARAIAVAMRDRKSSAWENVREVDAANLAGLKTIVSKYGFPTPHQVGEAAASAMLMLVAHADSDLEFQKSVARKMDQEVAAGTLPSYYPAVLRSIRPRITGASARSDDKPSVMVRRTYGSPKECYEQRYKDDFNAYIRRRYKPSS
ncbi:hypothetical protein [Dyella lutea]|uniref:Uncharacterized protein n=1 Tax=Dyella lutea TaxID=2950441 RepID=A0ABT1FC25_9GAMM|nr:hypothetical protein [Dyella lutea]MCP1373802.1 hypothetical protein [Dyella lutea]